MCFCMKSTSPDMRKKASSFEVYRWCRTSFTVAIVQLSSGTGYAGYTSASFTRMGEKPTANLLRDLHKILRLSGIPMRPSRKSSGIVKKYTPSECVTLKAHTLINWSKISPIKIVRLDFVEDHIAHQVLHLQVQEDI